MATTGRHSVFAIPSNRWYRPPEVREAKSRELARHAVVDPCWGCLCGSECALKTNSHKGTR